MDPTTFIVAHPFAALLFAPVLLPAIAVLAGAPLRRRVPALARVGSVRATIFAALWLVVVDAIGTAIVVRELLSRAFELGDAGLVRIVGSDLVPTALASRLDTLLGLQALTAVGLLALVPTVILAAWREANGSSLLGRVAPVVATAAIALPVAAAAIATLAVLDAMILPTCTSAACLDGRDADVGAAVWAAWNAAEVGRWAIVGLAAMGLMAATPIVMEAAARGHVVDRRRYLAAQALFVVGFGAWALTRLLAEDVARGPIDRIAHGELATDASAGTGLDASDLDTIDLPRGAWCHVDEIDARSEVAVPLVLTHSLEGRWGNDRLLGVDAWVARARASLATDQDRPAVLVAALDMRITSREFGPYLRAAEELGIEELAIVTFTDERQRTLTLGDVYTRRPCVLVRTDLRRARQYTLPGVWWGSLSHRLTEDAIR